MKFFREVYKTEILPSLQQFVVTLVRGIKSFFGKLLHILENPWSSATGIASQQDDIHKAFQQSDWFSFFQGILLVLGALAIYDSPFKNWGVIKGKISPSPTPPMPTIPEAETEIATDIKVVPKPKKVVVPLQVISPSPAPPKRAKLPYEDEIEINKENFINKVWQVAEKLSIKPGWLMIVMWIECKFNRSIVNKFSGTVGLIQWTISNICKFWVLPLPYIPHDKKGRIIITPEIRKIHKIVQDTPGVEQIDKVYDYLKPYIGRMKSVYDVYLAVFYPYAIGKNPNFELGSERSFEWLRKVYAGNKGLDQFGDKDGRLEVLDVMAWVDAHIPPKFKGKL
jgi:hypothetical protein